MTLVYIGVGSNIERHKHIEVAVQELKKIGSDIRLSTIYECEAVGFDSKPFFNLVIEMKTNLNLTELAKTLRKIELDWGREQNAKKFAPRTLDLDIILFGDEVNTDKPQIPRSDIYQYAFVIQPLLELCAERVIPNDERTVAEIHQQVNNLETLSPVGLWFDY
ncbi:2-amino-4-hydroxy-6-hydroxymethyldihydropteridine diphosphokinase [Vibrio sonorensis]|uniref:2-amino-4-hydroxy-6- hydroxymethyldihydropteridine diphosphokinase n=1 Tax=Vibrio sonorensis TaxID=1004316 RepID=UPI0008D9F896|nr:2-amino-4-hydroxy-6-hydroxymethyldihydropteridine diphosphokinase [Vibrio sonorensis]